MSRFIKKLKNNSDLVTTALEAVDGNQSADTLENLGLALAKDSRYSDAIVAYSMAMALDPLRGILYRYRGHRYISVLRFEEGVSDLELASRLIPENWDVWYHLGLGHFLLGRYEEAKIAYEVCYKMSYDNDSLVAITNWLWLTLKRLGLDDEAANILSLVPDEGVQLEDNEGYYDLLRIYKGVLDPEEVFEDLKTTKDSLKVVTIGFGLSNSFYFKGNDDKRKEVLEFVVNTLTDPWQFAFGYLASQVDLDKL